MKMKATRALTLALAFVLVAGVLGACSGAGGSQQAGSNGGGSGVKSKNLDIMRSYHASLEQFQGSDDINNNKLVKLLKEWSGYNVNYETLPKDNVQQKISVILASGDVPDLMWIATKADYFKLAKQGTFEPLDDLIAQHIPNLSKVFSTEELDAARLDGVLYGLPVRVAQKVGNGVLVRSDMLDELGLQEPKTLDELHDVLAAIKSKKNMAPLTAAASNTGAFLGTFAPYAGAFGVGTTTVVKNGKLEFSWVQPEYKQFLTTMKAWFDEGLIDQEFAINKDVKDRMINGTSAVSTMYWADAKMVDDAMKDKGSSGAIRYIAPPVGADGQSGIPEQSLATSYFVIPKQAKNKEGAADYYNFLLDDKTDQLITYGIEGEDYTVENGEIVQTLEQSNKIPWRTLYFMLDTDESFNARLKTKGFLPYYDQLLPFKTNREETAYAPAVEAWDSKFSELSSFVEENSLRFIMGKRNLSEFDQFVNEFNAKGGQAAIDAMNDWYTNK